MQNNSALMTRDHENSKFFYDAFNLSVGKGLAAWTSNDKQVTYALSSDIFSLHQSASGPERKSLFRDMVLIIDEVDDLIVDKDPVHRYKHADQELGSKSSQEISGEYCTGEKKITQGCSARRSVLLDRR